MTQLADNIAQLKQRIVDACECSGRRPEEITLVAVTKRQSSEVVREAFAAGLHSFGENYVQEAIEKRTALPDTAGAQWHLIGHLQSNKAKLATEFFDMVQSIDSFALAQTLGRHAAAQGKSLSVLAQVHLGTEETKSGFAPEIVLDTVAEIGQIPGLVLRGLMGIAPAGEEARPYFKQLYQLFEQLPEANREILSMGMTGDFETAIEEGTTMIRVGTALFGPRTT